VDEAVCGDLAAALIGARSAGVFPAVVENEPFLAVRVAGDRVVAGTFVALIAGQDGALISPRTGGAGAGGRVYC
jgi:hypothetical protein